MGKSDRRLSESFALLLALALAALSACSGSDEVAEGRHNGTGGSAGSSSGGSGGGGVGGGSGDAGFDVFPGDRLDEGVTQADAAKFDAAPGAVPPFVFDPPSGAVLPNSWPSPRFLIHTEQLPELVQLSFKLGTREARFTTHAVSAKPAHAGSVPSGSWWGVQAPKDFWNSLKQAAGMSTGELSWSVAYVAPGAATPAGAQGGSLRLLADSFDPDVTYWALKQADQPGGSTDNFQIRRLAVSSATSQTLIDKGNDNCIGCHTSSPDGEEILYQRLNPWYDFNTGITYAVNQLGVARPSSAGASVSPIVSPAARALIDDPDTSFAVPSTSQGAWSDGSGRWVLGISQTPAKILAPAPPQTASLALLQLDATNPTLHRLPGAAPPGQFAALPAWSPDATRVVYVVSNEVYDGHTSHVPGKSADLWSVSVSVSAGGAPVWGAPAPLPHASNTPELETYPSFSSDGKLIAFARGAAGLSAYDEETSNVYLLPADGSGTPHRVAGNDAPNDASVHAGVGLTNSWPRFGEKAITLPDGTYYFLLHSSRRGSSELWQDYSANIKPSGVRPIARLYLSVVRVAGDGSIESYPSVLLPGQAPSWSAHTVTFVTVTSVPKPVPQ